MENDNSYLNLLGELQAHYSENKFPVYVPTQANEANFTPISVKQHKTILKTDNNILLTAFQFNININDMILENINADGNNILLVDKASILLCLKAAQSDTTIKLTIDNDQHEIDLKSHVSSFKNIKIPKKILSRNILLNKFKIKCKVPTLHYDNIINKSIKSKLIQKDSDTLLKSMGEIFVYEILKFIETIDTGSSPVDFYDLTFDQKVQVCEMIPLELSNKIIEYINEVKAYEQKYTKCKTIASEDIELPLSVTLFAGD
jgi:hypothetical protein